MKKLILITITIVIIFSCNFGAGDEFGYLQLSITDAPVDAENIESVWITITEIGYQYMDEWQSTGPLSEPLVVDLLTLTHGKTEDLIPIPLAVGTYKNIRFILDIDGEGEDSASSGCYIEFTDGTTSELFVPSGEQSGYKANGTFEITNTATTGITTDFDLRKAVVKRGNGSYLLKPVIRMIKNDEVGSVTVPVDEGTGYNNIIVFAYIDGEYIELEAADPVDGEVRFPNAVNSVGADLEGNYTLPFLPAGTYDIVIAGYNDDTFVEVIRIVEDVVVAAGETNSDTTPPGEVSALAGVEGIGEVTLSWINPSDLDFDYVEIWYGIGNTETKFEGQILNTGTILSGLENGVTYSFLIKTVDDFGNKSTGISMELIPSIVAEIDFKNLISVPGGTFIQQEVGGAQNSFSHTIASFQLAQYEVIYELWYEVYQWALLNGYIFGAPWGMEGNDGVQKAAPTEDKYEPVTTNWRNAILWCNAYSEIMGYNPVYKENDGSIVKNSLIDGGALCDNAISDWTANGFRLPTEGEWHYAASYQDGVNWTPTDYASGDDGPWNTSTTIENYGWYSPNSLELGIEHLDYGTNPVGQKLPNQLGIYDMSGNVSEYCWDWFYTYPSNSQENYRGPGQTSASGCH